MAVQCPYCRHELSLKKAPPGMYTTACPDCGRKFYLAVPEDPAQQPIAAPIPAEREPQSRARPAGGIAIGGQSRSPDRAGEVESKAARCPVLTLPEHARLDGDASRAGSASRTLAVARHRRLLVPAQPILAAGVGPPGARIGSPSARRLSRLERARPGRPGAGVPGEAVVAQPQREP